MLRRTLKTVLGNPLASTSGANVQQLGAAFARAASSFLDKKSVTERVVKVVKDFDKVDPNKVEIKSNFSRDLGLDSLDTTEVVMAIEEEFGVEMTDDDADKIQTVEDAVAYVCGNPNAK